MNNETIKGINDEPRRWQYKHKRRTLALPALIAKKRDTLQELMHHFKEREYLMMKLRITKLKTTPTFQNEPF